MKELFVEKDKWTRKRRPTRLFWLALLAAAILAAGAAAYLFGLGRLLIVSPVKAQAPTPTPTPFFSSQAPLLAYVRDPDFPWLVTPPPPEPPYPRPKYPWPVWKSEGFSGEMIYDVPEEVKAWLLHDYWECDHEYDRRKPKEWGEISRKCHAPNYPYKFRGVVYKPVEEEPGPIMGVAFGGCSEDGRRCVLTIYRGKRVFRPFDREGNPCPPPKGWPEVMEKPPAAYAMIMIYDEADGRWKVENYREIPLEGGGE